ncbi:uncharacterized protein [Drosophila kikkawai]|uniref:Uncharacterized protein n=1 Tax=Drosophila kikkawai TaxID=30033 RepID=A0ABM4G9B8_DROKI
MNQLRRKKSLRALRMHITGYTLEDLRGFGNLEQLALDMKTDIGELTRCCRENAQLLTDSGFRNDDDGDTLVDTDTEMPMTMCRVLRLEDFHQTCVGAFIG